MKRISLLVLAGAITFGMLACNGSSSENHENHAAGESQNAAATAKSPTDSLFDAVVALHDEAMPKMSKLMGYQKLAQTKIDSLGKLKDKASIQLKTEYTALLENLKSAEKGMNDWMDTFTPEPEFSTKDSLKIYYEAEKVKAQKMRDDIFSTLDSALAKLGAL
jgi:hypothetical protein